ncbi:uncharacterized protein METZ01_LOCUS511693 [marine metagenome]|uniref:Uncharacterized protein n=1 Tax=marine metagenome TaxID=408172 RepID=A0A383EQD5_9ZZZZ
MASTDSHGPNLRRVSILARWMLGGWNALEAPASDQITSYEVRHSSSPAAPADHRRLSAQPAQYKQLAVSGQDTSKAQKGGDAFLEIEHQRPRFRLRGTGFVRRGWDRISWTTQDVEVQYASTNDSRSRAWGAELMLRGQVGCPRPATNVIRRRSISRTR